MKRTELTVRLDDEVLDAIDAHIENGALSFNEQLNHFLRLCFGMV